MSNPLLSNSSISRYANIINAKAKKYNIPSAIIATIIQNESNGNPDAFNGNNAENSRGLMQISERTAMREPLMVNYNNLNDLYDPDYNIEKGTQLLSYIRDFLSPVSSGIDKRTLWIIITSSYNQGEPYYKAAIEQVKANGQALTWENIRNAVLNPRNGGRKPWRENVYDYGPKAIARLSDSDLATSNSLIWIVVGSISVIGLASLFFALKNRSKILRNPMVDVDGAREFRVLQYRKVIKDSLK